MKCKNCGHKIRKVRVGRRGGSTYAPSGYLHWTSTVVGRSVKGTGMVCWCGCHEPEPKIKEPKK